LNTKIYFPYIFLLFFAFLNPISLTGTITFSSEAVDANTYQLTLDITVTPPDFFYKDYIDFSVDHPAVSLSEWQTSIEPISQYDPSFKETKHIYNKNFSIELTAKTSQSDISDANLYFTYYQQSKKKIKQKLFSLNLVDNKSEQPIINHDKQQTDSTTVASHNITAIIVNSYYLLMTQYNLPMIEVLLQFCYVKPLL